MAGDGDLIFREEPLAILLGAAAGSLWDLRGIAGAGKSVLLWEVERRAGEDDVVVLTDMQDYFAAAERAETAADGTADAGRELRRFGRALSAMVSGLTGLSPTARQAAEKSLNAISKAMEGADDLGQAAAHERAGELIDKVRLSLSQPIAERAEAGGRVYVLTDTFDVVAGRPLGQWFLRLLAGLEGAIVVVARRQDDKAPVAPLPGATQVLEVGGLTADEVGRYLGRRLGAIGTEITAAVHGFTGGHALAVGLTADLVSDMRLRNQAAAADGALQAFVEEMAAGRDDPADVRLNRLIERFTRSAEQHAPDVRQGLYCLLALRRFDRTLLERLLAAAGLDNGLPLAQRLISYSFVERRTAPGGPADQYYVVHESVRAAWRQLFGKPDNNLTKKLYEEAEDHYQVKVTATLDDYDRWFRYEDPHWQASAREWLYYVEQLDNDERSVARLGLLKLFLDGFWWWGNYISFPFCEELLADWAEMADRGGKKGDIDQTWGQMLRELYLLYPKGWRREATTEDWEAILDRILFFTENEQQLPEKTTDPRIWHIQGILKMYLAEAERFLDPHSEEVDELLQDARRLFNNDDDEWNVAWVSFQLADALLWRGDLAAAVEAADDGWNDLTEMENDDFELAANLHRVHADAAWDRGEHGLALDLYARAALSAYKLQVDLGNPDIPPLDEYTQAFMAEMHERAAARLTAMQQAGEDQAVREAAARIRGFFAPYWRAVAAQPGTPDVTGLIAGGQAAEAVGQLFPPIPEAADLHQPDTAYTLTANKVLYRMKRELAKPPGTALPPVAG